MSGDIVANDTVADCISAAVIKSDVGGRTAVLVTPEIGGKRWIVMPLDHYKEDVERPKRKSREQAAVIEQLRADNKEMREALTNAKFALEYWQRESAVWLNSRECPDWMTETRRRGRDEISRSRATLSRQERG